MALDRQHSPYRRGTRYELSPIPLVAEHCIAVDAGAVQLVVESRRLTNAILDETYGATVQHDVLFDDGGATLHVCGTDDGLEYLRFDCFEGEPHYHYLHQPDGGNTVVRIDEVAVGDPLAFTVSCVEGQLPEMLRYSGATDLAAAIDPTRVRAAMAEVRALMEQAAQPASS